MTKETGGPAFPITDLSKTQCEGMTLRDYFAGQALIKIVGDRNVPYPSIIQDWNEYWAQQAYLIADDMLAARKDSNENK